jgi:hypothetical protein
MTRIECDDGGFMNRRVVSGTISALAAIVVAAGSRTLGAFDDETDIPANRVAAGVLQLDLHGGVGETALTFAGLEPGDTAVRRFWIVSNDAASSVSGTPAMTVAPPVDVPGDCAVSRGKALGDLESGIGGCVLTAAGATGTPDRGVASRLLAFTVSVAEVSDAAACAGIAPGDSILPSAGPGNLADLGRKNATLPLRDPRGFPSVLAPGHGLCVIVRASWPPDATDAAHATPEHPVDNAAQGDSVSIDVRFTLTQVAR